MRFLSALSDLMVPVLIFYVVGLGLLMKQDVFGDFLNGAKDPSFQAAAAALKSQFTIPEKVQSIILTRGEGRTPMPEREQLHLLARSQSTMCIFLSAGIAEQVQEELLQEYPETTPVAVCYHLTWKDERIYRGELKDLAKIVKENNLTLTTMIVVGEAIDNREGLSRLYAHEFKHLFRR